MQLSLICFELAFAVPVMCIAQLKFHHRSAAAQFHPNNSISAKSCCHVGHAGLSPTLTGILWCEVWCSGLKWWIKQDLIWQHHTAFVVLHNLCSFAMVGMLGFCRPEVKSTSYLASQMLEVRQYVALESLGITRAIWKKQNPCSGKSRESAPERWFSMRLVKANRLCTSQKLWLPICDALVVRQRLRGEIAVSSTSSSFTSYSISCFMAPIVISAGSATAAHSSKRLLNGSP